MRVASKGLHCYVIYGVQMMVNAIAIMTRSQINQLCPEGSGLPESHTSKRQNRLSGVKEKKIEQRIVHNSNLRNNIGSIATIPLNHIEMLEV